MARESLKHIDAYRKRLGYFAAALRISIEYKECSSEGIFFPSKSKIVIDKDLSDVEEIATLLHELGHALDDFTTHYNHKELNRAYDKVDDPVLSKKNLDLVLKCERRAWLNGVSIANRAKIRLGKWYTRIMQESLNSYKNP